MDFGKAFTYPFEDPDWARKVLIPALIGLIPILGQIFLLGWTLDIARRVIRRDPFPLPELNFSEQLGEGFRSFVVGLVYSIPIFVLVLPMTGLSIALDNGSINERTAATVVSLVALCCGGLVFIYSLLMWFVLPAAYTHAAVKESIGAGLRWSEVFGLIRANPGAYLMVLLGTLVGGLIAPLGSILCLVGVIATYTYSMAVMGHLYGQAYREATQNQNIASTPYSGASF